MAITSELPARRSEARSVCTPHAPWALRACGALLLGGSAFAPSLVNGGAVNGTISVPGEQDTYTFDAERWDWFEMRLVDVDTSDFTPQLEVYNPRGELISTKSSPDVVAGDSTQVVAGALSPTPPGTYTVVVSDASATHTGAYDLHFVLVPGANAGGELL